MTPRVTRLHRAADAGGFRRVIAGLVEETQPFAARDAVVVVPTRAAGDELRRRSSGSCSGRTGRRCACRT